MTCNHAAIFAGKRFQARNGSSGSPEATSRFDDAHKFAGVTRFSPAQLFNPDFYAKGAL